MLTDFDLASWKKDLDSDYTKTSQQRTGTPPFMAHGLLDESEALHLYRHDVESLFYVMLIMTTHYEIQLPTKGKKDGGLRTRRGVEELPYQQWFNQASYRTLASLKNTFFMKPTHLNLSPAFEDFRGWILGVRRSFLKGFRVKQDHIELQEYAGEESEDEAMGTFDDETLGGHVDYSALINPVRKLKGKLKGLIIRYDPPTGRAKTRR